MSPFPTMISVQKYTILRSTRSFSYSNSSTTLPVVLPLWKVRRASKACEKRNICPTKGGRRLSCSKPSNILSIFSTLSNIQIKLKAWQNKFWCSYCQAITKWYSQKSANFLSFLGHSHPPIHKVHVHYNLHLPLILREREPTFESPRSLDFQGLGVYRIASLNNPWAIGIWVTFGLCGCKEYAT